MSQPEPDAPLLGVVVSSTRIEAQLVERTPFGRLHASGKRMLVDVDGALQFATTRLQRQVPDEEMAPDEERAAGVWVQAIADVIAKLTFGARGGAIRVGLAIDAQLDGAGQRVLSSRDGPRIENLVESVETALRDRGIGLIAPLGRAVSLIEAYALGEIWSPLGGLAGGIDGVLVMWDQEVGWADVIRGRVVRSGCELPGSRLDLGLASLDTLRITRFGEGQPIAVGARRGDENARGLFNEAALALGKGAARRLLGPLARDLECESQAGGPRSPLRIVLAGTCARFAVDGRLADCVLTPFAEGLAIGLRDREDAAMEAGLLEDEGVGESRLAPGVIHVGQDVASAVVGAAATALKDVLPRDEPGNRPGPAAVEDES